VTAVTLVTGGAGFAGRRLAEKLRGEGERVRVFDLAAPAHDDDMQGSITDAAAAAAAMADAVSVFHLAGNAQLWAQNPAGFDEINRKGTDIVVAAAIRAGVSHFVHCSSLTTLVGKAAPIGQSTADETLLLGPYPKSKLLAERIVEDAAQGGFNAVIALPTEPVGAGDESLTPPTKMILDFANGKTPAFIDCILNFVPVDSLADGLIACRDRGRTGERYLLGGANTPLRALLAMVEKLTGRPMPKTRLPYWVALGAGAIDTKIVSAITGKPPKAPLTGVRLAGRQVSFSSQKAERALGWRAGPVEPALRETIDWLSRTGRLG